MDKKWTALSVNHGYSLVFWWLLAVGVLWLLGSLAPGINEWMKENQHLSGWVQGIGSLLAVVGAFTVMQMQINAERAAERERRRLQKVRSLHTTFQLLSYAAHDAGRIRNENMLLAGWCKFAAQAAREAADNLGLLSPFEVDEPMLFHRISSTKNLYVNLENAASAIAFIHSETLPSFVQLLTRIEEVAIAGRNQAFELLDLWWTAEERIQWRESGSAMVAHMAHTSQPAH